MTTHTNKELGQSTPSGTTAVSIYSPASGVEATIKPIYIVNISSAVASFSIYCDSDGTTYDTTTQLFKSVPLAPNETYVMDKPIMMNDSNGNLAVQSSVASALTFTVYGMEVS